MRMKRVLLASTALALLAGAQQAQAGDLYISVFGGANWVADSSANFTDTGGTDTTTYYQWNTDADTGFVLGGAVGTHLDNWAKGLKVELEASYRRNDVAGGWAVSQITDGGEDAATGAIDANISTFAMMANVWYEHDMGWKVRPYIGGGLGWANAKLDGAGITTDGTDTFTSFDEHNSGFAWQLGVGLNYEAMPGVDLGLGYRYFNGPDFDEPFGIDPWFAGKEFFGKVDNNSHSVLINLTVDIN